MSPNHKPRERQGTPKVRICEYSTHHLDMSLTIHLLGVVMTHGMMAVGFYAQLYGINLNEIPVCISYLPLAHIYGVRSSLTARSKRLSDS